MPSTLANSSLICTTRTHRVTSVPLAWLCFIIHDSLLWCLFSIFKSKGTIWGITSWKGVWLCHYYKMFFFSQPKHGEFVVRSCKETANSWQGCNCGKDCKNNPFLPLEKCTKYTLHLEILISADFHGQNHWLLPGLLLLCHLLHWSSHFFEAMLQPQLLPNSLISFWDLFGQSSQELTNFTPVHGIKLFMWTHRVGSNFLTEKDGISLWEEKIWLPELAGNIPVCHRAGEAVTNLSAPFDLHVTTPLLFHPLWNISLRFVLSGQRTGFLCNYVKVAVLPRPQ